jgi:hypothetical protein
MSRVVGAVSAIHCATTVPKDDFSPGNTTGQGIDSEASVVVGWRKGKYAVLPSVLLTLSEAITKDMLGLRCVDEFIANVATRRDGQICSTIALSGAIRFSAELFEGFDTGNDGVQNRLVQRQYSPITLGAPVAAKPDRHLYLNLERSPHDHGSTEPDICLCGRLDGEALGHASIQDVLCTLALSWTDDEGYCYPFCTTPEHQSTNIQTTSKARPADTVYKMAVGTFVQRPGVTPRCKTDAKDRYHVYVQVAGSSPWTLFLAGLDKTHNRICFDCTGCAPHTGGHYTSNTSAGLWTLIGYGSGAEDDKDIHMT